MVSYTGVWTVLSPFQKEEARSTFLAFTQRTTADLVTVGRAPPEDRFAWEASEDPDRLESDDGVYQAEPLGDLFPEDSDDDE